VRIRFDCPADEDCLEALVLGLSAVNAVLLRRHPHIPSLYDTRVVYRREPARSEDWWNVLEVLEHGFGDCEDLVAWRVGECLRDGIKARPAIYRSSARQLHVVVLHDDGSVEDPSAVLGMLDQQQPRKRRRRA
jgi:hypothetical protein